MPRDATITVNLTVTIPCQMTFTEKSQEQADKAAEWLADALRGAIDTATGKDVPKPLKKNEDCEVTVEDTSVEEA